MDAKNLRYLKWILTLFTIILIVTQFYLLSFKLPFELATTNKNIGFFSIYLNKLTQNFHIWLPLIGFMLAHIAIQALLTIIIYLFVKNSAEIFPVLKKNILLWGILIWLGVQLFIFLWNAYLFPYSFFAIKFAWLRQYATIFLTTLILLTTIVFSLTFIVFLKKVIQRPFMFAIIIGLIGLTFFTHYIYNNYFLTKRFTQNKKPNVIIIITDSLRPQYALTKSSSPDDADRIENIVANSAFFNNTFTLLGRSSPGLVSILTGNYPKTTGARFNLIPSQNVNLNNSLTTIFKAQGYQTIFMADGRQFINLDKKFNFDQIIAAKGGIYDFIFSFINDTPLSNLLMNTHLGAWLFPYNYANRNTYYTYLPHSFVSLVNNKLMNEDPQKPAFIVTALTIAHWPYVWARQPQAQTVIQRYEDSVKVLDQQFSDLIKLFRKRGLLQNSLIVILSDHGDALGLPGDRITTIDNYLGNKGLLPLIPRIPYTTKTSGDNLLGIDTSAGHGTDLLSMTQLNTTLAFHFNNVIQPQIFNQRVALIDVAPTVLDLLNIKTNNVFDGISLKPLMFGHEIPALQTRPLFLESEIDIPLIDVTKLNKQRTAVTALIEQYANLYDINLNTMQLTLTQKAIARLLPQKQLGIIQGDWLLAYFPGKNALTTTLLPANSAALPNCYYVIPARYASEKVSDVFCYQLRPTIPYFVLVNLNTKKWQILFPNDAANNPIFKTLLAKLQSDS